MGGVGIFRPAFDSHLRSGGSLFICCVAVAFIAACSTPTGEPRNKEPLRFSQRFVAEIDNPYFPLKPGSVYRLEGTSDNEAVEETITVTDKHKIIQGVTTTVVQDVGRKAGAKELTHDWYAQDRAGNVWYFGEDTAEYENGEVVSTEGSWEAGVDGARAGIIVPANPQVNDATYQELAEGVAVSLAWVVETGLDRQVPAGQFSDVIHTLEWSPQEPRVIVEKFYAPSIGLIEERALSGADELVKLQER